MIGSAVARIHLTERAHRFDAHLHLVAVARVRAGLARLGDDRCGAAVAALSQGRLLMRMYRPTTSPSLVRRPSVVERSVAGAARRRRVPISFDARGSSSFAAVLQLVRRADLVARERFVVRELVLIPGLRILLRRCP